MTSVLRQVLILRPLAIFAIALISGSVTSVSVAAGEACQHAYNSNKIQSASNANLVGLLERGFDPSEYARHLRSRNPSHADQILDETTKLMTIDTVVKFEPLGGGVNASFKITYSSGLQAVYKPVNPDRPNQPIREMVAYRLSRLLGLDIVPPTVAGKIQGPAVPTDYLNQAGSIQVFVKNATVLTKGKNADGQKILLFKGNEFKIDRVISGRRLRVFDWLINNHDRGSNAGNYLISDIDGVVIGIDHSVSFVGMDKQARSDKAPYYREKFLNDAEFFAKLTSKTEVEIRESLRGLNPTRIEEFLGRYQQLLNEFRRVLGI